MSAQSPSDPNKKAGTPAQNKVALALLASSTLFLFADQNLMAPNLTQIAREFGMNEVERDVKLGGQVALGFWILGGIVSLLAGYLTDRISRKRLFVVVTLIGALPCLLTGYARTYEELFFLRTLTGIGIGGALPLVYSLIGDFFPARKRAAATAFIGFAMGLGIALGQLLAGMLGPEHGWRLPFKLVAAPNLLLAPLIGLIVREPGRGQSEEGLQEALQHGETYHEKLEWANVKNLFKIKTNLFVFLQGIPGTVPWGIFFAYFNDYLAQDKGLSVQTATLVVMMLGAAAIAGGLLGGLIGSRLYQKNPSLLPIFSGIAALVGIVPTLLLIQYPSQKGKDPPELLFAFILSIATGLIVAIPSSNVRTMLINVNSPQTRGTVFSLYNLADDLGKGLGPAIIGAFIIVMGRNTAFIVASLFWIICGVVLIISARAFPADEKALQERLRARALVLEQAKSSGEALPAQAGE